MTINKILEKAQDFEEDKVVSILIAEVRRMRESERLLAEALEEMKMFYVKVTGLPAVKANAALSKCRSALEAVKE